MNKDFFTWLADWHNNLSSQTFKQIESDPEKIAIISVDMVAGFCHKGPLASPKVKSIIPNVVALFKRAHTLGNKHFLLLQDTHDENAEEFHAYPPHCIKGTDESQNIPELALLPFAKDYTIFEKNALSPTYDTKFDAWIKSHPKVTTYIIVGDCTDLCVYSIAMHLRMQANARQIKRRVIVAAETVATYDLSVAQAKKLDALPHPEKLLHPLFLYHMALNGVEVYKEIT